MLGLFKFAWYFLSYEKIRNSLLLISTILAFLVFGVLGAFSYSLNSGDSKISESRLIVAHRAGLQRTLPFAMATQLVEFEGIDSIGHGTWTGSYYEDQQNMLMMFAVDPEVWLAHHPDMIVDPTTQKAFLSQPDGILVAENIAAKYGWQPGDVVALPSILYASMKNGDGWRFTVSGTFESSGGGDRNYLISHYQYLNENRPYWQDTVGTFMVKPRDGYDATLVAEEIDQFFANSEFPTSTATDKAFHQAFFKQFGNIVQIIQVISLVAFVSLTLVITSGMSLSTWQRVKDFAILKTLGVEWPQMLIILISQSVLLVGVGAMLGLGLAGAVNELLSQFAPEYFPDIELPQQVVFDSSVIMLVIIIFMSVVPVLIAFKADLRKSLNGEFGQ